MLPQFSRLILEKPVVFGQIDFVNCLPITLPLKAHLPELMTLAMGTPGELNQRYKQGDLDIGAMSAHYLLSAADFDLIDTLSISSLGAVGSVFFFSRLPLAQLDGKTVGLPRSSATSISLLKVLLTEEFDVSPNYQTSDDPNPFDGAYDACLMIGDAALAFDQRLKVSGSELIRVDMGEWWTRRYQLPMVFGVWGARKSYIDNNNKDFEVIRELLGATWQEGLTALYQEVIAEGLRRTGLSFETMDDYFQRQLDFSFGEEHKKGLNLFETLCKRHGLL